MINWNDYLSHEPTNKPNKLHIPLNQFSYNKQGVEKFNEIYHYCLEMEKAGEFQQMVLTKSKGICIKKHILRGACWSLTVKRTFIEILIRNQLGFYYRFIIGHGKENEKSLGGRRAFQIYTSELLKDNVNIEDLAIENGEEVKKEIPKQKIECKVTLNRTYYNVHHLDINSAYNAGMIEAFPILAKPVKRMYDKRKIHTYYKNVLAMTQGYMQSELVNYKYSHISKAGYVYTNNAIDCLSKRLEASGRRIIAYNTDGIWYQGDLYHDEDEGTDIGQWKTDHKDCTIRFKSHGCYEFLENDKYYPVFRGESSYEAIKPKEKWEWGDIFNGEVIQYQFIEGIGVIEKECY